MTCKTDSCTKEAEKGRSLCHACAKRRYVEKHPFKFAYQNLKGNAKRRGKVFDLTFEEFKKFAVETEYWHKRGKKSTSLHIDRKDETLGYTAGNIQPLENCANLKKYRKFKERTAQGAQFEVVTHFEPDFSSVPF